MMGPLVGWPRCQSQAGFNECFFPCPQLLRIQQRRISSSSDAMLSAWFVTVIQCLDVPITE